jgi:hypothetical protein
LKIDPPLFSKGELNLFFWRWFFDLDGMVKPIKEVDFGKTGHSQEVGQV